MPKAVWNDKVIAESDNTILVEGNHYFPPESLQKEYFCESDHQTTCGWKGTAKYFDIGVDGKTNKQAAWYYPEPKSAVANIRDYVAFWNGVQVQP